MKIVVLLFASTREIVGKSSIDLNFDKKEEISLKSLLLSLERLYPELNESPQNLLRYCSISLNENYVLPEQFEETKIREGDEVALLPPVSGG